MTAKQIVASHVDSSGVQWRLIKSDSLGNPSDLFAMFCSVLNAILIASHQRSEAVHQDAYARAAVHEKRAYEYDELDMRQSAIAEYRKAVAILPNEFDLQFHLGVDELRYGSSDLGTQHIVRAFKRVPPRSGMVNSLLRYDVLPNPSLTRAVQVALRDQADRGSNNPMVYVCRGYDP